MAIADTGASESFVSDALATHHHWRCIPVTPHSIRGANGTIAMSDRAVTADVEFGDGRRYCVRARVIPLTVADAILGIDFLHQHNIEIRWRPVAHLCLPSGVQLRPNGDYRVVVDYRPTNAATVPDAGGITLLEFIFRIMAGACYFTVLDLRSGYMQIRLTERARQVLAITTPFGLFLWNVMPFGARNAPAHFMRVLATLLHEHAAYCVIYLDDFFIVGKTREEVVRRTRAVLATLREHKLYA